MIERADTWTSRGRSGGVEGGALGAAVEAVGGALGRAERLDGVRATPGLGAVLRDASWTVDPRAEVGAPARPAIVRGSSDARTILVQEAGPDESGFAPAPPEDGWRQRLRENRAISAGAAQGRREAAWDYVTDVARGVAEAGETALEAGTVALEGATGWVADDYAAGERAALVGRARGAVEGVRSLPDLPAALVERYAAEFALADRMEEAYRSGRGDLSLLQEASRVRGKAEAELAIMAGETAATVVGVGAALKGLRGLKLADMADPGAALTAAAASATATARDAMRALDELIAGGAGPVTAEGLVLRMSRHDDPAMAPEGRGGGGGAPSIAQRRELEARERDAARRDHGAALADEPPPPGFAGADGVWDGRDPSQGLSDRERAFVQDELTARGAHTVEAVPRSETARVQDFLIDGEPWELKSPDFISLVGRDADQVSGAISNRINRVANDGRGQSPNIVVDMSHQDGLTEEIARRGADRAFGQDRRLIERGLRSGEPMAQIRVVGPDFDITIPNRNAGEESR